MLLIISSGIIGLIIGGIVGYFIKPTENIECEFNDDEFDITEYRIDSIHSEDFD